MNFKKYFALVIFYHPILILHQEGKVSVIDGVGDDEIFIDDEIDILDEINEVAVVKTLSKSTSKDKSKKYKSFKEN